MNREQLFPTTVVGSWPRPNWLLAELRKKNRGEITYERFDESANDAVLLAIKYQEDAGIDIITDGEQRRDNFYSFVVDKLEGIKMMTVAEILEYVEDKARYEQMLRALDVPAFSIKSPVAIGTVKKKRNLALDEFLFLRQHTGRKTKVTIPGPYMLTRASWVDPVSRENAYWTREELAKVYVRILREEILALRDAGADFIQLDEPTLTEVVYGDPAAQTFMCAAIFSKVDPKEELKFATDLINSVTTGIDGVRMGVHVCRGNWSRKEEALLKGDYGPLLPYFQEMKVRQLVLEFATKRAGELSVFKDHSDVKEIGLGVVNPRTDEVENFEQITAKVQEAVRYFDPSKVFLNPDCGFGTFAEAPVNTASAAFAKLRVMAQVADKLRKAYA